MKLKVYLLLIIQLVVCHFASAQTGTHTKKKAASGAHYWEYLPPSYDASGTTKYPLILFLHGCGERAYLKGDCGNPVKYASDPLTELDKLLVNGIPKEVKNRMAAGGKMCFMNPNGVEECFIALSPQLNNGYFSTTWDPKRVDSFLEEMKRLYPIDLKKIYLTGLSLGGIGAWNYSLRHPDKLAAMVPISGLANSGYPYCNLSRLPIWAFHDDPDGDVAASGTTNMERNINACPGNIRVTLYKNFQDDGTTPKPTHSAWGKAYSNTPSPSETTTFKIVERLNGVDSPVPNGLNVYTWFLSYSRSKLGPLVDVEANKTIQTSSTTISATASVQETGATLSYSWELMKKDPTTLPTPVLEGANTRILTVKNLVNGKYTFRLTIKDSNGNIDTDDMLLTVNQPADLGGSFLQLTSNSASGKRIEIYSDATKSHAAQVKDIYAGGNTTLQFYIKTLSGQPNLNSLQVGLTVAYQSILLNVAPYLTTSTSNGWTKVSVPLATFNHDPAKWTNGGLSAVTFKIVSGFGTGNIVFGIDEIQFTGGSPSHLWYGDGNTSRGTDAVATLDPVAFYISARPSTGGVIVSSSARIISPEYIKNETLMLEKGDIIELYNMNGKKLKSSVLQVNSSDISTLVQYTDQAGLVIFKILKRSGQVKTLKLDIQR